MLSGDGRTATGDPARAEHDENEHDNEHDNDGR